MSPASAGGSRVWPDYVGPMPDASIEDLLNDERTMP